MSVKSKEKYWVRFDNWVDWKIIQETEFNQYEIDVHDGCYFGPFESFSKAKQYLLKTVRENIKANTKLAQWIRKSTKAEIL